MTNDEDVRSSFRRQAKICKELGSPFTARLLTAAAKVLDHDTQTGRVLLTWTGPPDATGDAIALRLAGALHGLVRANQLPELASLYPPAPLPREDMLAPVLAEAIHHADDEICSWLASPPQTNEVARSAVLYAGLKAIADQTALPLQLFEVGASAGLNLVPDRLAYQFGNQTAGDLASSVKLAPKWSGPPPPNAGVEIVSRRGCDRNPLDLSQPATADRLMAYIWPDQQERLDRTAAAIALTKTASVAIDQEDAAPWVEANVSQDGSHGCTRVLFHSIAFQYFDAETKDRIRRHMNALGETATQNAPLAWLAFEADEDGQPVLTLRLWPERCVLLLAKANAHVGWIEWLGPSAQSGS